MSEITVNVDPENIPVVQIVVDENSAQSAIDAAAAAQAALDAIANTNFGDKLDKGGYVGTAQTLKDDIDAIVLPDDILVHGAAPVTNGTVNIAANAFEWRLSQIVYNNSAYSNLINPAANGSSRIDLFCLNNLGTLEKVVGDELIGIAPEPAPNPGTLGAFFVAVNGAVIGAPSPIMTSNKPILEREKQPFQVYNTGEINDTYLDDFFYGYLNFRGAVTDLKSCRVYQNTFLYSGKEILVKNSQATDITIFHLNGLGFQFSFPNAENLVLKPNEIIRFSMKIVDPSSGVLEYVGRINAVASVAVADVVGLPTALATKVTQTEIDALGTQLLGGAPADANTLKELNDKILAVQAIIGGATADGDSLVNTVAELLAVFSTYSEGVDLVSLLAGKVDKTDIYNALDCIVAGKVLDARQGKVLTDLIAALTTAVSGKEPASANIQLHIASAHAPSNAQKNSDITKAEIEAKLTGEITAHTHPSTAGLTVTQVTAQTLTAASWTLVSGFYEYNLSNANITTTSIVDVIPDNASVPIVQVAQVLPRTLSGIGTVKLYSTNLPTGNIVVTINIWK